MFYNNPAQSVIVNVESPSPGAKGGAVDAAAKPDSSSTVVEQGRAKARASKLALEKQKTENHRQSRDREKVNKSVPDMIFSDGDVRSSTGHRSGAFNTQALAMKAPSPR